MRPASLVTVAALVLASTASAGTLTLSPAAVPLRGRVGQSTRQSLTLANGTDVALSFELEAKDVVVRDGTRLFVDPGVLPASIAATAVFSARGLTIPAGGSSTVDVLVTLPPGASHRAVVALFRGTTRIGNTVPSLGALLTFTLSEQFRLEPSTLIVEPQSPTSNFALQAVLSNPGDEPIVPKGVVAILDARGALVGRVAFESRRLLPGERATVRAEYPGELASGAYRALATFEYEGRAATREAAFEIR
jgi:hypothetical protein